MNDSAGISDTPAKSSAPKEPLGAGRGRRFVLVAIALESALGVTAYLLGWIFGTWPSADLRITLGAVAIGVAGVVPLCALFALTWNSALAPFRRIREALESVLIPELEKLSTFEIALISVSAGIGEELLFRGFFQARMEASLGSCMGLIAASLLFGLAHPITSGYVVVAGLMGLYLGGLWQLSGNLASPITAHALYDFLAIVWMVAERKKRAAQ